MKITVKEAARLMGKSEMFVRMGLRNGTFKFGIAQKMPNSSKYTYYICPKQFYEYLGINSLQGKKAVI